MQVPSSAGFAGWMRERIGHPPTSAETWESRRLRASSKMDRVAMRSPGSRLSPTEGPHLRRADGGHGDRVRCLSPRAPSLWLVWGTADQLELDDAERVELMTELFTAPDGSPPSVRTRVDRAALYVVSSLRRPSVQAQFPAGVKRNTVEGFGERSPHGGNGRIRILREPQRERDRRPRSSRICDHGSDSSGVTWMSTALPTRGLQPAGSRAAPRGRRRWP